MAYGVEWGVEDRIEAAIAWLITGSTDEAEKLCGIPSRTIRSWQKTDWWDDILDQAKGIKQKEVDALWTGAIHKATAELKDRLLNGDWHLTRQGTQERIPVKARDLVTITATLVDKRAMARGQATTRSEKVTVEEKLDRIGSKLEEQANEHKQTTISVRQKLSS